ncbi:MAG: EAL domain-containing protein [Demequina sp.]|jgi:EAL domain-containing protein (putative c-di-GMP-specific phosphodiesterase class I)|nr:EAL domain-containing protein [Demequina sp.]
MTDQLRRVTIFDADTAVAHSLAEVLEQEGFEARATADPDKFVEWASDWLPALSFVDIVGDEHQAMSVLDRLARARSRAGIVIMCGSSRGGIRAAREFGAAQGLVHAGLLRKPFSKGHVLVALARNPHALETVERVADPLDGWSEDQLAEALNRAIEHEELHNVYQPKISCTTGKPAGFEALARWDHPTLGHIPPSTFIPYATEQGLLRPITEAVTARALEWLATARAGTDERISINFSTAELKDREQLRQLIGACEHFGVAPERVALEVSHTSALADDAAALTALRGLEADGFHLVIDDFGTGYSTAARLAALPFREVKIDTRFVRKVQRSDAASSLVESLVMTARDLDIECTGEGVENQQILDKLAGWGCDFAQGYYIARPMPSEELEHWLAGG